MKRRISSVFFALILAISLPLVTAPSLVEGNGGPESYQVDADTSPLVIAVNRSSAAGQVFRVGQTLNIDGYVSSTASVSGYQYYSASLYWSIDIFRNGRDLCYDFSRRSVDGDYAASVTATNETLRFPLQLTDPGDYVVLLTSSASVAQFQDEDSFDDDDYNWENWDSADLTLSFKVVTADLITEGRNPTDVGDLFVGYAPDWPGPERFIVNYVVEAPWQIVSTQVYIGTSAPTKSSPGQFGYTAGDIPFTLGEATSVNISAYAQIRMQTGVDKRGRPIYTYAGVWARTGADTIIGGKGNPWATYFEYTPILP